MSDNNRLKFRAWNKFHKTMYRVYGLHFDEGVVHCESTEGTTHTFGFMGLELLQYSGIKDKNGAEIYEDCDRFTFKYMESLSESVELVGVMTFNDEEMRYEIDIDENEHRYVCLSYISNGTMYDFEVIGNIYEGDKK